MSQNPTIKTHAKRVKSREISYEDIIQENILQYLSQNAKINYN